MKRMSALMLLAMFVMLGCESDNPVENTETPELDYYIFFDQTQSSFAGLVGETVTYRQTITIMAGTERDSYQPVAGVSVRVGWRENDNAQTEVWVDTVVTGTDGKASVTIPLQLEKGRQDLNILATTEYGGTSDYVTLNGYSRPVRMSITAPTNKLIVPHGQVARMTLNGLIVDSAGVGVPDMELNGWLERSGGGTPYGGISYSRASNSAGNFLIYYNSTGGFGSESIVMTGEIPGVEGTFQSSRFTVETVALQSQVGALSLYALPGQVVLPAEGETVVVLNALVLGTNGSPLPGVTVEFESSLGVIQNDAVSDSVGFAKVVWHTGVEADTASITAYISGTEFEAMGSIQVVAPDDDPVDPIARITLYAFRATLVAGSGDETTITAFCQSSSGGIAAPGSVIEFFAGEDVRDDPGRLSASQAVVDHEGKASVQFMVGTDLQNTWIHATYGEGATLVNSNEIAVSAVAGEAEGVNITLDSYSLEVGESTEFHVLALDRYNNPVAGERVTFSITRGSITPLLVTDATGSAVGVINSGVSSGVAEVNWVWRGRDGSTTLTFVSSMPNSIHLSADPLQIIREGGDDHTTLSARVLDRHGNPIGRASTVVFELIRQPEPPNGCTFPNGNQIDSAITEFGVAEMTLNAGDQIGGVLVRAYTWRDPDTVWVEETPWIPGAWRVDTVSVMLSTVQVVAGPPSQIEFDIDPRGVDAGGGIWSLTCSLRGYDDNLNPSNGEYPVSFTIEPDEYATIAPSRMVNGQATTTISYPSSSTFRPITVHAYIDLPGGVIETSTNLMLPLQRGFLTLSADPQNWMFNRDRPNDIGRMRVWAILRDGHDIEINNAPIIFSTDRARYYWLNQAGAVYTAFFPNVVRKYTGVVSQNHNEPPGTATVYLQGIMNEFYLDEFTLEVNVHIEARVEGMDVFADPVTLFITRH